MTRGTYWQKQKQENKDACAETERHIRYLALAYRKPLVEIRDINRSVHFMLLTEMPDIFVGEPSVNEAMKYIMDRVEDQLKQELAIEKRMRVNLTYPEYVRLVEADEKCYDDECRSVINIKWIPLIGRVIS